MNFKISKMFSLLAAVLVVSSSAWAYGPQNVNTDGAARKYTNLNATTPLTWNAEKGPLQDSAKPNSSYDEACKSGGSGGSGGGGCSLSPWLLKEAQAAITSNSEGVAAIKEAFDKWQGVPDANVSFVQGTPLDDGGDVTICNVDKFIPVFDPYKADLNTDPRICGCISPKPAGCSATCQNPIIFDTNGDIVAALLGEAARYTTHGTTIAENLPGQNNYIRFNAVINGACLEGTADPLCPIQLSTQDIKDVIAHEMGHAIGLAHSQVNPNAIVNGILKPGFDAKAIPLMYPTIVKGSDHSTLHKDDQMSISHLYPKASFSGNYCRAVGNLFQGFGAVRCAEVVLRNSDTTGAKDQTDAISGVSGVEIANNGNYSANNFCTVSPTSNCGRYEINGLVPGQTYKIEVNKLPSNIQLFYCPNLPSFTPLAATGSITCSAAGKTVACDCSGISNCEVDADLCHTF